MDLRWYLHLNYLKNLWLTEKHLFPQHKIYTNYLDLKQNGILVRYFNAPRIDGFLRITIGTDEEMDALVDVLKSLL